ncbi:MAG: DUF2344 domain-containing protein, partial [Desulfuromonas sp.]|nr:DUF2344 domain-containing protein [Desulfuromonas sp.]
DPAAFVARLNAELPKDFKVEHAHELPWNSPVPAMAIHTSTYWVPLNPEFPPDLHARINAALGAESILHTRTKKDKQVEVDLRPDIADLRLDKEGMELTLHKGSPVVITAYLLRVAQEQVRSMGIRKTKVSMKNTL